MLSMDQHSEVATTFNTARLRVDVVLIEPMTKTFGVGRN